MKVYTIVFTGDWYHIVQSIFSTREKAEAALAAMLEKPGRYDEDYFIDEVTLDQFED
jgi:uncharacterized protein YfcZ (UPF0381/DUF406 family)